MKKSLVALAALAVSGAAMAQATLYGVTDIGYGVKAWSAGAGNSLVKQTGVMDGGLAGSRIGFRGTEDLGAGMKAHFVTEQGISPTNAALFGVRTGTSGAQYDGLSAGTNQFDTGTGGAYSQGTNRQTYVALEGGFGTIRVGYQYTAAYEMSTLSGYTNTSEGVIGGQVAHLWGAAAVGGTRANGIAYISPRMNGFRAQLQVGSAGGRELTEFGFANAANGLTLDKQQRNSLQIDYDGGRLKGGIGYTTFTAETSARAASSVAATNQSLVGSTPVITTFSVYGALSGWNVAPATAAAYQSNLLQLAGSYDFGAAKVGVTMNSGERRASAVAVGDFGTTIAGTTTSLLTVQNGGVAGTYAYASRAISAEIPMGKTRILVGMGTSTGDQTLASTGVTSANAEWATRQVGAVHDFSKRTALYGFIGSATDNLRATTSTTGVKDMSQSLVGIRHQF